MDMVEILHLGQADLKLLRNVPEGIFDYPVDPVQAAAFLGDPLLALVLARVAGVVVGMASATVLLHPDKQPSLFINEVGVHEAYRRQGIATQLTQALIAIGRARGCKGVWIATESDNAPARALYQAMGGRLTEEVVIYVWDGAMDP